MKNASNSAHRVTRILTAAWVWAWLSITVALVIAVAPAGATDSLRDGIVNWIVVVNMLLVIPLVYVYKGLEGAIGLDDVVVLLRQLPAWRQMVLLAIGICSMSLLALGQLCRLDGPVGSFARTVGFVCRMASTSSYVIEALFVSTVFCTLIELLRVVLRSRSP